MKILWVRTMKIIGFIELGSIEVTKIRLILENT